MSMKSARCYGFGGLLSMLLLIQSCQQTLGRSNGAPFDSCLNLTPKHGSEPSQPLSTSPYKLNATKYFDNETGTEFVYVQIISTDQTPFRGFVVQARLANNPDIIVDGQFQPEENDLSKTYTCKLNEDIIYNNTWTHRNANPKQAANAIWIPANVENESTIVFVGTILKDKKTFWENNNSDKIVLGPLINLEENENLAENSTETVSDGQDGNETLEGTEEGEEENEEQDNGSSTEEMPLTGRNGDDDRLGESSNQVNSYASSGFQIKAMGQWEITLVTISIAAILCNILCY